MLNSNNKWFAENPLLKNKDQRYYYDFGTGKKIEREDVKAERDAFLDAVNGITNRPQKKETDDFLEGFADPYGEKEEQRNTQLCTAPKSTKPMFPNTELHAKPKNESIKSENTQFHPSMNNDAFLEGFNNPTNGEEKTTGEALKEFVVETVQDIGAHIGLHNTAHAQYPWTRYAEPLSPAIIGGRITSSSAKVSKHKDTINEVANRYNVPREIIGGIIFKEQLTKSAPDFLVNFHKSFINEDKRHSTGLGAVSAETARAAWGCVNAQKELPKTDAELQYKLTHDKKFNIETIAAVLLYEAERNKIISDISEASNLTTDQWREAVAKYNGSDEYARKVYEYLPITAELLD